MQKDIHALDEKVKNALERFEPEYDPASWDLLSRKLDQIEGLHIDQIVKPVLERHEAPFAPADWGRMAQKLDGVANVRRLRYGKLIEAAIVVMIVANIQLLERGVKQFRWIYPEEQQQAPVDRPMADLKRTNGASARHAADAPLAALPHASFADRLFAKVQAFSFDAHSLVGQSQTATSEAPISAPPLSVLAYLASNQPEIAYSALHAPVFSGMQQTLATNKRKKGENYVLASAGILQHRTQLASEPNDQIQRGLTGRVLVGRRHRWGVESGLAYQQLEQVENNPLVIYEGDDDNGYHAAALAKVSAQVVSTPLHITRRIARKGRTSVHATGGVTAHFAGVKRNAYRETYFPTLPASQPVIDTQLRPDQRPLGQGVFEGGSVARNVYATADAGIRIERRVSDRSSVFIQPEARFALNKRQWGGKPARTNSVGVHAGVLTYL